MSEFDDMSNHDQRGREPRTGEYQILSIKGTPITCYVEGVKLVDFYRTPSVLAKDVISPPVGGTVKP